MTSITNEAAYQLDNSKYSLNSLHRINKGLKGNPADGEAGFSELLKTKAAREGADAGKTPRKKTFIDKKDKLYEQCEALETFLLKTLINGMRKTVEKAEFSKSGFAGEMYEDMLYDEYAKDFTRNANFGLAELAYLELSGRRGKPLNTPL
ncbi:MAG: rod-binding protein [Spirochaetaceae bacterium]|jgi:flagellar protein FlgJ|nr:rod-binding protein [Spirochaetaceae bacterium]